MHTNLKYSISLPADRVIEIVKLGPNFQPIHQFKQMGPELTLNFIQILPSSDSSSSQLKYKINHIFWTTGHRLKIQKTKFMRIKFPIKMSKFSFENKTFGQLRLQLIQLKNKVNHIFQSTGHRLKIQKTEFMKLNFQLNCQSYILKKSYSIFCQTKSQLS